MYSLTTIALVLLILLILTFWYSTVLKLRSLQREKLTWRRGRIFVRGGETVVEGVDVDGVTLDITRAGYVIIERTTFRNCNPCLYVGEANHVKYG